MKRIFKQATNFPKTGNNEHNVYRLIYDIDLFTPDY